MKKKNWLFETAFLEKASPGILRYNEILNAM
jgi:hypothetical protein